MASDGGAKVSYINVTTIDFMVTNIDKHHSFVLCDGTF